MPTDKKRWSVTVDDDVNDAIKCYQEKSEIKSTGEAILSLALIGLGTDATQAEIAKAKIEEIKKASAEAKATAEAKQKDSAAILIKSLKNFGVVDKDYKMQAKDINFLSGLMLIISAYFEQGSE